MDPKAVLLADAKVPFSCGTMQVEISSPLKHEIWVCLQTDISPLLERAMVYGRLC